MAVVKVSRRELVVGELAEEPKPEVTKPTLLEKIMPTAEIVEPMLVRLMWTGQRQELERAREQMAMPANRTQHASALRTAIEPESRALNDHASEIDAVVELPEGGDGGGSPFSRSEDIGFSL